MSVLAQFELPCKKTLTVSGKSYSLAQIKIVGSLRTNEILTSLTRSIELVLTKWLLKETNQRVSYVIFPKVID